MGLALVKLGVAISDNRMLNAGSDIAYMAEHQRVVERCSDAPTVEWAGADVLPLSSLFSLCSSHAQCAHLSGSCCPTSAGILLGCCDNHPLRPTSAPPATSTCSSSVQCALLAGDCCTAKGVALGCCLVTSTSAPHKSFSEILAMAAVGAFFGLLFCFMAGHRIYRVVLYVTSNSPTPSSVPVLQKLSTVDVFAYVNKKKKQSDSKTSPQLKKGRTSVRKLHPEKTNPEKTTDFGTATAQRSMSSLMKAVAISRFAKKITSNPKCTRTNSGPSSLATPSRSGDVKHSKTDSTSSSSPFSTGSNQWSIKVSDAS